MFRKPLLVIAYGLLPILLLGFGLLLGFSQIITDTGRIKSAVHESGIYDTAVNDILERAADSTTSSADEIPVQDPVIRQAIAEAFPPELLKSQTEGAIDDVFAWLKGSSNDLRLNFDLDAAKATLADNLAAYADRRLAALPVCTSIAEAAVVAQDLNAFTATCVPPNFDRAAAVAQVRSEIASNEDLQFTKTSEDITADNQQLQSLPTAYRLIHYNVWGSGILSLVFAALIVWCSRTKLRGIRQLGIMVASVGGIGAIVGLASNYLITRVLTATEESAAQGQRMQTTIIELVDTLTKVFRDWWLWYSLALLVVGIALIVVAVLLQRRAGDTGQATPVGT